MPAKKEEKNPVEVKAVDMGVIAGVGATLLVASTIWLLMIVLYNTVFNLKDISSDGMVGIVMASFIGGAGFGLGVGFLTGVIVRYRIEKSFIKELQRVERERSLDRFIKA